MFAVKCALILCAAATAAAFELGDLDVIFHLYTRTNPTQSQPLLPSVNSIMTSSFSLQRQTIITIHSNGEGVGGNFNAFVVPAHLDAADVNVVAVDWSPGSGMYSQGLGNAPQCGEVIAQFMNIFITQFGYSPNYFFIVGVGLGGHVAGFAARNAAGTIPHITALDPSLTGWTHHPGILKPSDAGVVEVVHTSAGTLGYDYPLGDIDFYANGGSVQGGCGSDTSCSHIFSYVYYAESITAATTGGSRFVGTKCTDYAQATTLQCSGERDVVFGGFDNKQGISGVYIFLTNNVPPFARD